MQVQKRTPKLRFHSFITDLSLKDADRVAKVVKRVHHLNCWPSWNQATGNHDIVTEASLTNAEITELTHFINGVAAGIVYGGKIW